MRPTIEPRPDSVLRLFTGFFLVMMATGLVGYAFGAPESEDGFDFIAFLVGNSIFQFGVLLIIHLFVRENQLTWRQCFGFDAEGRAGAIQKGVFLGLVYVPVSAVMGFLIAQLLQGLGYQPQAQDVVETFSETQALGERVYFGLVAVLVAPFWEESFFRGLLYPILALLVGKRKAAIATAVLFSLTHGNVLAFIPLAILGWMLVFLYEHTGTLWAPVAAHASFNGLNLVLIMAGLSGAS